MALLIHPVANYGATLPGIKRQEALVAAYESIQGRLKEALLFDQFQAQAEGWEVHPVEVNRQTVGAIMRHGPEIHACIKPEGFKRWFNKQAMQILEETVERYGYAQTSVAMDNKLGKSFVQRLGFKEDSTEGDVIIYKRCKHGN